MILENPVLSPKNGYREPEADILAAVILNSEFHDSQEPCKIVYEENLSRNWDFFELNRTITDLSSRVFEIKDCESLYQFVLFKSVKHYHSEGYMAIYINPDAKPYLLPLKDYFKIP